MEVVSIQVVSPIKGERSKNTIKRHNVIFDVSIQVVSPIKGESFMYL